MKNTKLKLAQFAALTFALFCLSGGPLYLMAMAGNRVLAGQALYVATTPYFLTFVLMWLFGGYLIRDGLHIAQTGNRKAHLQALIGFALIFAGYLFLEDFVGGENTWIRELSRLQL